MRLAFPGWTRTGALAWMRDSQTGPISAVVGDRPKRVVATLAAIVQKLSPCAT